MARLTRRDFVRGAGKWQRATWEEAPSDIADRTIDALVEDGPACVAWEPFQFKGRTSHQALIGSPINPIGLAGGYFHLQPTFLSGEPGTNDRATRVEVERSS